MSKTARLEIRVDPGLKERLHEECERRGMKVATFVERAVLAALEFEGDLPKPGILHQANPPRAVREVLKDAAPSRTSTPGAAGYSPLAQPQRLGKGFVPPRPKGT